jgi:hypothetical protein
MLTVRMIVNTIPPHRVHSVPGNFSDEKKAWHSEQSEDHMMPPEIEITVNG